MPVRKCYLLTEQVIPWDKGLYLDPVPVYMFAAVIAFFSLVAVEFYERIYRNKIEDKRESIWRFVQIETEKVKNQIQVPSRSDPSRLSARLKELNKLVSRPDDFIKWRKYLAVAVVLLGGLAAYVAYMPYEMVFQRPNMEWFLLAFFLVIAGNGFFIYEVFKVDEQITTLEREDERMRMNTIATGGAQS